MDMWSKSNSIKLSSILVKFMFVCCVAAVFLVPAVSKFYDGVSAREPVFLPLCLTLYFALVPAFILLVNLNELIENMRDEKVFIERNCAILRLMSYCCFAIAAIFFGFGFFRFLAFLISFAAVFFGIILRVLKNVLLRQ
ncbi:MAG: DUF2975 domain-containing protein [Ruminococcaceae bacterium]|nr:DUF2975 domain-containing protein [Oscillospiraceae bacterium]